MIVRVVAFAQLRESFGSERSVELPEGSTLSQLRDRLRREHPAYERAFDTTRLAHNGAIARELDAVLCDGDEVAMLPPVGGG